MQLPPSFKILFSVGMVARIRLSSVTLKLLSSGTLKSTRISARLPLKLMSLIVFMFGSLIKVLATCSDRFSAETKLNVLRLRQIHFCHNVAGRTRVKNCFISPENVCCNFTRWIGCLSKDILISERDSQTLRGLHQVSILLDNVVVFRRFFQ